MKDFLEYENHRNKLNYEVYTRFLRAACAPDDVLVVHHITFKKDGEPPNEIPSADTLMFDHELMKAVFGEVVFRDVMVSLAMEPCESREAMLVWWMDNRSIPRVEREVTRRRFHEV